MLFPLTTALFCSLTAIPDVLASGLIGPSTAYQIFQAQPDLTMRMGDSSNSTSGLNSTASFNSTGSSNSTGSFNSTGSLDSTRGFNSSGSFNSTINFTRLALRSPLRPAFRPKRFPLRRRQDAGSVFKVSKGVDNSDAEDLVVSFTDLQCPLASPGPYSFEFNFVPEADYTSTGSNQINVFKINGTLPAMPTYNNLDSITASMIGTFNLPTGEDAKFPKLFLINQLVCEPEISLRFGISQYSSGAGAVAYISSDTIGVRELDGT